MTKYVCRRKKKYIYIIYIYTNKKRCKKSDIMYFPIVSKNERILQSIKHRNEVQIFYSTSLL